MGDYVVKPFTWGEASGFAPRPDVYFRTRKEANERAHFRPDGECGAIAYHLAENAKTGVLEANVFARRGDVPGDLCPYFSG